MNTPPRIAKGKPRILVLAAACAGLSCVTGMTYDYDQTWWVRAVDGAGGPVAGIRASIVSEATAREACTTSTDASGWARLRLYVESTDSLVDINAYTLRMLDRDSTDNGGFFDTVEVGLDFSADTLVIRLALLAAAP
jgi:hypothetical protein